MSLQPSPVIKDKAEAGKHVYVKAKFETTFVKQKKQLH